MARSSVVRVAKHRDYSRYLLLSFAIIACATQRDVDVEKGRALTSGGADDGANGGTTGAQSNNGGNTSGATANGGTANGGTATGADGGMTSSSGGNAEAGETGSGGVPVETGGAGGGGEPLDCTGVDCVTVSSLVLWLDGADPENDQTPPNDASALATWSDRSGNAHDAIQATGNKQPTFVADGLNGLGVVRFDGIDSAEGDELDIDNSSATTLGPLDLSDATIFAVVARRYVTYPHDPGFFGIRTGGSTRMSMHFTQTANRFLTWNNTSQAGPTLTTFVQNQFYVIDVTWSSNTETQRIDGVVTNTQSHAWSGQTKLPGRVGWSGASDEHWNGDIAELIVFNAALGAPERDEVAGYLEEKWFTPPGSGGSGN
jgi:hypothetical protein